MDAEDTKTRLIALCDHVHRIENGFDKLRRSFLALNELIHVKLVNRLGADDLTSLFFSFSLEADRAPVQKPIDEYYIHRTLNDEFTRLTRVFESATTYFLQLHKAHNDFSVEFPGVFVEVLARLSAGIQWAALVKGEISENIARIRQTIADQWPLPDGLL